MLVNKMEIVHALQQSWMQSSKTHFVKVFIDILPIIMLFTLIFLEFVGNEVQYTVVVNPICNKIVNWQKILKFF